MRTLKRIIISALVVALISSVCAFTLSVSADDSAGTAITNAEELANIAADGTYYLANDILITGKWTSPESFSGTLDGKGHTIVFSDATVKGGLFNQLQGATIKNLKLSDGKGELHRENTWKIKPFSVSNDQYVAPLADIAYGTIENVISDIDLGDQSLITTTAVGGIVACRFGGDLVIKNCISLSTVKAGKYAGGIIATSFSSGIGYDLTVTECVNYGDVYSQNSAGGIVGHNNGHDLNLSISKCANFGNISNASNNQGGGISGYLKPFSESGSISITGCVNFGNVFNLGPHAGGSTGGQYGGILGRVNTNKGAITVKNNLNYASLASAEGADKSEVSGIMARHNGAQYVECSGNYSVPAVSAVEIAAEPANAKGSAIDENTFDALNTALPDTYVKTDDGKIGLSWMKTAGLTSTAPEIEFTVDYSAVGSDDNTDSETDKETDDSEKSENSGTEETESDESTSPAPEETKKGCGAGVSAPSAVLFVTVVVLLAAGGVYVFNIDNTENKKYN
ncbi:MAG: hypothetical protein ACI3XQ_09625 [Eubacteriales bacterium]